MENSESCAIRALMRRYCPGAVPPVQVEEQLVSVMPLAPGQPQNCDGAGVAEIVAAWVALATALEMPAVLKPYLAA